MNLKSFSEKYFILDRCIVAYLFVWLFCFILNLIVPTRSILALPVLNWWYSFLGIAGVGLVVVDLFTQRIMFQTKYFKLLAVLFVIICVSALLNMEYGVFDNAKAIMWYVIQVALLYSLYLRFSKEQILYYFKIIFHFFLVVWTVATLISLFQYLFLISYDVVIDGVPYHQGIFENRVFGIFRSVGYGPLYSLFLLFGIVYFWRMTNRKTLHIFYFVCSVFLFIYILLSGSRTILLGLYFSVFCYAFLFCRCYFKNKGYAVFKLSFYAIIIAILCCLGSYAICHIGSDILGKCPSVIAEITGENDNGSEKDNKLGIKENKVNKLGIKENNKRESELKRTDVNAENISNNRFTIWQDYYDIGKQHFWFGLSLRNDVSRILDQYSDYFIVQYFKEEYPESFSKGEIYGTHNNFVNVFVQCGFLGFFVFIVFLLLSIKDIICYLKRHADVDHFFLFLVAIMGNILLFLMFECEVFFEAGSLSAIFWVILGMIQKYVTEDRSSKKVLSSGK